MWPKHAKTHAWVKTNDAMVRAQVAAREHLPAYHSTAALGALGRVRDMLDSRRFVLRNARRTTAMLGLVRLHLNGVDSTRGYAATLRGWLNTHGGIAPRQRSGYDTGTGRHLDAHLRAPASLRA